MRGRSRKEKEEDAGEAAGSRRQPEVCLQNNRERNGISRGIKERHHDSTT